MNLYVEMPDADNDEAQLTKRKKAIQMIHVLQSGGNIDEEFKEAQHLVDHNPAIKFDEKGRLTRWEWKPELEATLTVGCCRKEYTD